MERDSRSKLVENSQQINKNIDELQRAMPALQAQKTTLQNALQSVINDIYSASTQTFFFNEELNTLRKEKDQAEMARNQLKGQLSVLSKETQELQQQIFGFESFNERLTDQKAQIMKRNLSNTSMVEGLEKKILEAEMDLAHKKTRLEVLEDDCLQVDTRISYLTQHLEERTKLQTRYLKEMKSLSLEMCTNLKTVSEIRNQGEFTMEEVLSLKNENAETSRKKHEQSKVLAETTGEVKSINALILLERQRLENYNKKLEDVLGQRSAAQIQFYTQYNNLEKDLDAMKVILDQNSSLATQIRSLCEQKSELELKMERLKTIRSGLEQENQDLNIKILALESDNRELKAQELELTKQKLSIASTVADTTNKQYEDLADMEKRKKILASLQGRHNDDTKKLNGMQEENDCRSRDIVTEQELLENRCQHWKQLKEDLDSLGTEESKLVISKGDPLHILKIEIASDITAFAMVPPTQAPMDSPWDTKAVRKHIKKSRKAKILASPSNYQRKLKEKKREFICTTEKADGEQCGEVFRHKQSLSRHNKIHRSEAPFHCDHCGHPFIRRDHFTAHNCLQKKLYMLGEHESKAGK